MSYEMRPCRSCYGCGEVVADVEYDATTGELVQAIADCPICKGAGSVSVYVYGKPDLRRMATEQVMWMCWHGSARERTLAEKEIARREGSQWR